MAWSPPPTPTPFNTPPEDVLFVDVETVPKVRTFEELDEVGQNLFIKKFDKETREQNPEKVWQNHAAFLAEFNTICCVSIGLFAPHKETGERTLRVKSFFGFNEAIILGELAPKLAKAKFLGGHFVKRFDFPLMARKFAIHRLPIPSILNVTGQKPWEVAHFDTHEIWAFNDARNYTSLDALAYLFGLPNPKEKLDGSKVADVYYGKRTPGESDLPWDDRTLQPVADYCQGDVITDAQLYLALVGQPFVKPENIVIV